MATDRRSERKACRSSDGRDTRMLQRLHLGCSPEPNVLFFSVEALCRCSLRDLMFDMSSGLGGAKRLLGRPFDEGVRPQCASPSRQCRKSRSRSWCGTCRRAIGRRFAGRRRCSSQRETFRTPPKVFRLVPPLWRAGATNIPRMCGTDPCAKRSPEPPKG